jgi:hypothetical protein
MGGKVAPRLGQSPTAAKNASSVCRSTRWRHRASNHDNLLRLNRIGALRVPSDTLHTCTIHWAPKRLTDWSTQSTSCLDARAPLTSGGPSGVSLCCRPIRVRGLPVCSRHSSIVMVSLRHGLYFRVAVFRRRSQMSSAGQSLRDLPLS